MTEKNNKNSNEIKIVTIIPLTKSVFKSDLTYFTSKDIENGSIVTVPVRNKKILGLVVSCEDVSQVKSGIKDMSFNLKKILDIKNNSIFRKEFLDSIFSLNKYYVSKKNDLSSFVPSIFLEKYDELEKFSNKTNLADESKNIKIEKLLFQTNLEDRLSFYKTLIRGSFALKKSVFIVLPTEYDIRLFYQSLSKGIEAFTFPLHSGLKSKDILESYKKIMSSSHGVLIIGTPQYLSIPRNDITTVIVEHENSNAYKTIKRPNFDLRLFVELFASKINAKLIFGDTLLRYETIARKETEGLNEVHPISFRTNFQGKIEIIEKVKEANQQKFKILSEEVIEEIENKLENKKNVFIFSLRKGLASYTVCKDCNNVMNCDRCSAPLVLYLSKNYSKRMFICNKCGNEKNPETICSYCGSWNLIPLGIGTDTVYEEIKGKFSKNKIYRLDKETIKTSKEAEKVIKEYEKNHGSILIGTEMAFFYLKEKVVLSVIASFDSLWSIPNFRISEKIIQILFSIIERTEKKLIINTKNKNDKALLSVKSENLLSFVREEIEDRKSLDYPPFKRFIKITFRSDKTKSLDAKNFLKEALNEYEPEIFSGFTTKNKNEYVTNALIKIEPNKWSLPEFYANSYIENKLEKILISLPPIYEIYVDPEDLL